MKKRVTNTTAHPEHGWLMGGNPSAIEQQESDGQKELVAAAQLPAICNTHRKIDMAEQYRLMGIEVIKPSKGDNLFLDVKLPKGWEVKATDHSMWSNLVDDQGRIRGTIFYKAAFYDRDAFVNLNTRYSIERDWIRDRDKQPRYIVKDLANNESIIFQTDPYDNSALDSYEKPRQECVDYMTANYPNFEDLNSYWD